MGHRETYNDKSFTKQGLGGKSAFPDFEDKNVWNIRFCKQKCTYRKGNSAEKEYIYAYTYIYILIYTNI